MRSKASPHLPQGRDQRLGLAWHPHLSHDPSRAVDHANRGLFQRHIQSGIVAHGCSFSMLVAAQRGPRFHHPEWSSNPRAETPITPSVRVTAFGGLITRVVMRPTPFMMIWFPN